MSHGPVRKQLREQMLSGEDGRSEGSEWADERELRERGRGGTCIEWSGGLALQVTF